MAREASSEGKSAGSSIKIRLPIDYQIPDDLPCTYAEQVVTMSEEDGLMVYIFQSKKPILMGDPSWNKKKVENLTALKAVCIAHFMIPWERAERLAVNISAAVEKRKKEQGKKA